MTDRDAILALASRAMSSDYAEVRKWASVVTQLLTDPTVVRALTPSLSRPGLYAPQADSLDQKITELNDLLVTLERDIGREYVLVVVPPVGSTEPTHVSVGGKPLTSTNVTFTGIIAGIKDAVNEYLHR